MPKPFSVTTASNSVFLNEDRKGEASFTVSNQSGRAIKGQARVVSDNADVQLWLSLRGASMREFTTASTERYSVDIHVPQDAPAGSHSFRLDIVGEKHPDEEYVEGPTVTFHVPEAEQEEAFPWKIVAAVLIVLVIGGGLLAYAVLSDSEVPPEATATIPDVSGFMLVQATDSLRAAGFRTWELREEHNDSIAAGRIIGTDPLARAQSATDVTILLRQSLGPAMVSIPNVANTSFSEAFSRITEHQLTLAALRAENHSTIARDRIIGTEPSAPDEIAEGSGLTLIVSAGPAGSNGGWTLEDWLLHRQVEVFGEFTPYILTDSLAQPGQMIHLNPELSLQPTEQFQGHQPDS